MMTTGDMALTFEHAKCIVTPDALATARSKKDVAVKDYAGTTVDIDANSAPHVSVAPAKEVLNRKKIYDNALELVGGTPMIRLDRLAKQYGLECELLAKCEFMSIGGSVKDRIAKAMVESAEKQGLLKPGKSAIVEATSGNTGVGMSLVSAVKGYRMLITLPEKMSQEKVNTMRALGAEIIRTPTEAKWNDLESHITLAEQLQATVDDCHFLDQYYNPANPLAHYLGTAEEILFQLDNKIDMIVMTAGTGGTISGVAKKVKEVVPSCVVVGVDPEGSILAQPESLNEKTRGQGYQVEGIGYDFIPSTLARKYVDKWVKMNDRNTFVAARECTRREGLLIGGSSGSALAAALVTAKSLKKGQRCVVLLPDHARNYMSKHYSDEWMEDYGFFEPHGYCETEFQGKTIASIPARPMEQEAVVEVECTLGEVLRELKDKKSDVALVSKGGSTVGLLTSKAITRALLTGRMTKEKTKALEIVNKTYRTVGEDAKLADVARILRLHDAVVVLGGNGVAKRLVRIADVADAIC